MIDIDFASKKLQKQFNEEKVMLKTFGQQRAKRIKVVMTALRAAPNLGAFAPAYSLPHRCHELTGKRNGTLSLDLDGARTGLSSSRCTTRYRSGRKVVWIGTASTPSRY